MKCEVVRINSIIGTHDEGLVVLSLSNSVFVVTGDHYKAGQSGVHIPVGGVVPEKILKELWLWNEKTGKGRLGGKRGNRVKLRTFDFVESDGLFYGAYYFDRGGELIEGPSFDPTWELGRDVSAEMGITE